LAYVLNLGVVRAAGPTVASTVTYVISVWSMAIGAVLLAEPVGWNTVVGAVVVVWWLSGSSSPASSTE
jgi:drug/metabolite transporter (DMT)-like permease